MSRFKKLSHSIWHCQYHIVWVPKYRKRILEGKIANAVRSSIYANCVQQEGEVIEMNIQIDHVHLIVMIPPKVAVSRFIGRLKGKSAIRVFSQFKHLKKSPYWGNHFWAEGYCVDTIGLDAEMIRKYVKFQKTKEQRSEQMTF